MGKFKPDPTDPVASAKGWTRRQRRVKEIERLQRENKWMKAIIGDREYDRMREAMLGVNDDMDPLGLHRRSEG